MNGWACVVLSFSALVTDVESQRRRNPHPIADYGLGVPFIYRIFPSKYCKCNLRRTPPMWMITRQRTHDPSALYGTQTTVKYGTT